MTDAASWLRFTPPRFPSVAVTPRLQAEGRDLPFLDWIDPANFNPGYLARGMDLRSKRLDKPQWQHTQDSWGDKIDLPAIDLEDEVFSTTERTPCPLADR